MLKKIRFLNMGNLLTAVFLLFWVGNNFVYAANSKKIPFATAARLSGDDEYTRFIVDISGDIKFSIKTLSDPYRVIIDLSEVNFQMPVGSGSTGHGLVSAYRYGLFEKGKSRIVLDMESPVIVDDAAFIAAEDGYKAKLVINMIRTDPTTFERIRVLTIDRKNELEELDRILAKANRLASAAPIPKVKPIKIRTKKNIASKKKHKVIVIDPGHGGVDPGAVSKGGTAEKSVVLTFSKELKRILANNKNYKVYMTRETDKFVRLRDRVEFARHHKADLFIAIHADSMKSGRARGATVYTLSDRASDKEAAALAHKENQADIIAGVTIEDESFVLTKTLIDLAQRETKNLSIFFADVLVNKLKNITLLTKETHRFAGFRVLKAPDVPSVLLELGYISNYQDEKLLKNPKWRHKMATSVAKSIDGYFSKRLAVKGF